MPLSLGTRLGPYEILGPIGAGGMGEVYRARDSKLNRSVAIKILLEAVALDPERLARFRREAHVLASLDHPNIAHVYGFEDAQGIPAIVMELVEGPTLADRIAQGAIPLDEALPIARQIAEALASAHDQGVVHRDLKPANIKVRPDGTLKILDFGLAKAADPASAPAGSATMSPTLSLHATQAGLILGTAAYMSPEQAAGKAVDRRTDVWSFGVVLLEMLTGRQAFDGETVAHVIAAVLTREPDWNALPANTPPPIRRLLRRCLKKDRNRRLDSAADARLEIEEAMSAGAVDPGKLPAPRAVQRSRWSGALPWIVAGAALVVGGAALAIRGGRTDRTPLYASLDAPDGFVIGDDDRFAPLPTRTPMVFTPDGQSLVIQAARDHRPFLVLRRFDRPDARPISGTDDARVPFLSPDGKWVGFWAANELRKVPIEGGVPTTICQLRENLGPYGVAWGAGDVIVFGDETSGRIMRVPAGCGTPTPVTPQPPARARRHVSPSFLPDGRRILFADVSFFDASDARLMVQSLDGGEPRQIVASATDGRLLPSGRLAFMRLGTLMTVAFDAARAEVRGEATAALADVMQSGLRGRVGVQADGMGMFAVSPAGALVVIRGPVLGMTGNRLEWVTRDGRTAPAEPGSGAPVGGRLQARLSPDGSRVIVGVATPVRLEIWVVDLARDLWAACADCNPSRTHAPWSPDGRRVLVARQGAIVAHALDGSVPDETFVRDASQSMLATAWLPDGRIVYGASTEVDAGPVSALEFKVLTPGTSDSRVVLPSGVATEIDVSRDGRWMAYTSAQSGGSDVFVQPFAGSGARIQVSAGRGSNPAWSPDGRTLYYLTVDRAHPTQQIVMAVDMATPSAPGKPRQVLTYPELQGCAGSRCYEISHDGERFLFRRSAPRESVTRMDLILNWTSTLPPNK